MPCIFHEVVQVLCKGLLDALPEQSEITFECSVTLDCVFLEVKGLLFA